jgi:hypothetical protein
LVCSGQLNLQGLSSVGTQSSTFTAQRSP